MVQEFSDFVRTSAVVGSKDRSSFSDEFMRGCGYLSFHKLLAVARRITRRKRDRMNARVLIDLVDLEQDVLIYFLHMIAKGCLLYPARQSSASPGHRSAYANMQDVVEDAMRMS